MKVYFACSSKNIDQHIGNYASVIGLISDLGHTLTNDWLSKVKVKIDEGVYSKDFVVNKHAVRNSGIKAIRKADALVADVSIPSVSVGYQIALALTQRKPVLCLYSMDFGTKKPPQVIVSSDTKLLTVSSYNSTDYKEVVANFFAKQIENDLIKFNFVISKEIERYLDWASDKSNLSKSQLLREKILDKIIKTDKEYAKHLRSES